jgi:hypothetical protein
MNLRKNQNNPLYSLTPASKNTFGGGCYGLKLFLRCEILTSHNSRGVGFGSRGVTAQKSKNYHPKIFWAT